MRDRSLPLSLAVFLLAWSWIPVRAAAADTGSIGIERKTATLKRPDKEADVHPHVALAAEPGEEYFLSYKELKPFIDEKGLLAPFTK
jgi:hypothetical protein